jgi:hypothetical protein
MLDRLQGSFRDSATRLELDEQGARLQQLESFALAQWSWL